MKRPVDQESGSRAGLLHILKTVPDRDKQVRHLKQMLDIYRASRRHSHTGPVQLEDGELDWVAAASGRTMEEMIKCPFCGMELPADGYGEHQRLNHRMP